MRAKRLHPVDLHEAQQIARAVHFTACRRIEGGRYDSRKADTLAAADLLAAEMGADRTMIYAVTPEGFTIGVTDRNRAALAQISAA